MADPRTDLRMRLAEALHDHGCACGAFDPADEDEAEEFLMQADAVLALGELRKVRSYSSDYAVAFVIDVRPRP